MFDETEFLMHVRRLFIKPETREGRALHAAVGIASESGEVMSALKATWIYERPIDLDNIREEAGDILFYVVALLDQYDMTLGEVASANMEKLKKRYPEGYTDAHANLRLDKE